MFLEQEAEEALPAEASDSSDDVEPAEEAPAEDAEADEGQADALPPEAGE